MTAAGDLRELVTIEAPTKSQRPGGGQATTWSDFAADIHARVQPVRGSEQLQAQQQRAPQTYLVTIRWREGVTTAMRVIWGSLTMNIRSASNRDERREFLTLECEAGGAPS